MTIRTHAQIYDTLPLVILHHNSTLLYYIIERYSSAWMHLKNHLVRASKPAVNGNAATESPFLFSLPFPSSFSLHHDPLHSLPPSPYPVQFISSLITPLGGCVPPALRLVSVLHRPPRPNHHRQLAPVSLAPKARAAAEVCLECAMR